MSQFFSLFSFLVRVEWRSPFYFLISSVCWFILGYLFALQLEQNPSATLSTPIWWASFLSLFLCPLLAMDIFYKKDRPDFFLLLRTLSLSPWTLILSYFLIRLSFLLWIDAILFAQFFYIVEYSEPDLAPLISSLLGLILLQISYLSVSFLCSALIENSKQVFFASFCILFVSWLLYYAPHILSGELNSLGYAIRELSIYKHFHRFLMGAVYEHDILFFAGFPLINLYLCNVVVKK